MKEIIIRRDVPVTIRKKIEGLHLIEVVMGDEVCFRAKQFQLVGDRWTSAGCSWYSEKQMIDFADAAIRGEFGEITLQGIARLIEYDDDNLHGERYLVRSDGSPI